MSAPLGAPLTSQQRPELQCRICLETDTQLLAELPTLTKLDPELARAGVMAADDLCVSCCLLLGLTAWREAKENGTNRAYELLLAHQEGRKAGVN